MENELVTTIADRCRAQGFFLASAESCTGGLLGHLITNLSGSSDFYLGGQITYSNTAKQNWLGVPEQVLKDYGAVSKETVLAMAAGIRRAFSDSYPVDRIIGISISGIAGPTGGTQQKPVGTVWVGCSTYQQEQAAQFRFEGSRETIKRQSAFKALEIILASIPA